MSSHPLNPGRRGITSVALSVALVCTLSSCMGGSKRASIEKMLETPEPNAVAKNIDSLLKKLEHPKRKIMPDDRCAMMTVAVELADRARGFAPDENTGLPIVPDEQYARLSKLLIAEIDDPGIYYKEKTLSKKGYQSSTVKKHLSTWAAYELANSDFGGQEKLNKLLGLLGNPSYSGYDLSWQRAAAYNVVRQIDLVKRNPRIQLEVLNRTHSARVLAGLPTENPNTAQAELDNLLGVIDSHILTLPLMNESLKSLKNNSDAKLIVAAIRRNYRLLDRLLDSGINEAGLQRHLYENIELLRGFAFDHADADVHAYARNTLVRFAPFTYLDGVIASEDAEKKKRWVQETIQVLPVMDAFMTTVTAEDLEVFALPAFTKAVAQLEGKEDERNARERAKESAKEALKKLDEDIKRDEAGVSLLPDDSKPIDEGTKLFLAFEKVSANIINPVFYFPINNFASKRQNFLDQTFSMLASFPSAEREFILSELYKQEPVQLLNYLSNNLETEHKAGQDYALQDMLILGNLGNDKRLSTEQQVLAREKAAWFLTQAYDGGDTRNLIEAAMQFIHDQHPMVLAAALKTGLVHFNALSQEAAWDYAQAYTSSLNQAITLTDKDGKGLRPDAWQEYLQAFSQLHDRWDFRPFTICIPFLLKENPNVLVNIMLEDKPLAKQPNTNVIEKDPKAKKEDPLDPKTNHDLLIARVIIVFDIMKRAKGTVDQAHWDKAVNFMIGKFKASNSEEVDYAIARGLIELDRDGDKPTKRVIDAVSAKYPGFTMLVADMDKPSTNPPAEDKTAQESTAPEQKKVEETPNEKKEEAAPAEKPEVNTEAKAATPEAEPKEAEAPVEDKAVEEVEK